RRWVKIRRYLHPGAEYGQFGAGSAARYYCRVYRAIIPGMETERFRQDQPDLQPVFYQSLIFAVGMFLLIWINFVDGVLTFHLKPGYLAAQNVFLFIGLMRIVDLGTGVNAQVISVSTFWRFDFFTGVILLLMALPLNYILTKEIGIIGPAISN